MKSWVQIPPPRPLSAASRLGSCRATRSRRRRRGRGLRSPMGYGQASVCWGPFQAWTDQERSRAASSSRALAAALLISSFVVSGETLAAPTDAHIKLRLIASHLSMPVYATSANDGSGRTFIVEKTGKIKILQKNGVVRSTPFLNISSEVSKGSEQGLLGLAFHPGFKTNHKLYVNFTNTRRQHGHPRVPGLLLEPERRERTSTKRDDPQDRAAVRQPQRRHAGLRAGRLPVHRDGRRRRRAAIPAIGRRTRTSCSARCSGSTSTTRSRTPPTGIPATQPVRRRRRQGRDLADRPAQPVALLVRPDDRRPLDRRRGAGRATRRSTTRSRRAPARAGA